MVRHALLRLSTAVAALGISLSGNTAAAQDASLEPIFGNPIVLSTGFDEDPVERQVVAGGTNAAALSGDNCAGFVGTPPDLVVDYTRSGIAPLAISAHSDLDTTLLVRSPDGRWHCDDDSGPGLNPALFFLEGTIGGSSGTAISGRYAIWVGLLQPAQVNQATVRLTEFVGDLMHPDGEEPAEHNPVDTRARPFHTATRESGLRPPPNRIEVLAGGGSDARQFGYHCLGMLPERPSIRLEYESSGRPLAIRALSEAGDDLTLVVERPDGTIVCDDDGAGGLLPLILLLGPDSGTYNIMVGLLGADDLVDAVVEISENAE